MSPTSEDARDRPGNGRSGGKYAVSEIERRFLLDGVPGHATGPRSIEDRYLDGTRLRLRTVIDENGSVVRKLGHKEREGDDPSHVLHTSIYLDEHEFERLAALPGRPLSKTRWTIVEDEWTIAVDEFTGPLSGLVMAEVDCGTAEAAERFDPPAWCGPEVTLVEAFTGGALAGRALADLQTEISPLRG